MKKILLGAALAVASTFSAQAADGAPFKFLLGIGLTYGCLLYTSPSPRDGLLSRMPSSA